MPGADAPAASRAKNKKHASQVTTGSPENTGIPCAMVLTVSFVLAPETGLVVSVIGVMPGIITNLISASGYQAHTTSPSAW